MAEKLVSVGIDLGMQRDPTAYCVAECMDAATDQWETRTFERIQLGTEYAAVVERLVDVIHGAHRRMQLAGTTNSPPIRVDATGVGLPVVQELRAALGNDYVVTGVLFTHGHLYTPRAGWPPSAALGKAFLVSRLQALFGRERIKLPRRHREAAAMQRELMDYSIKVEQDGEDKYGAFSTGTHDDLVTALGLAVIEAPQPVGIWSLGGLPEGWLPSEYAQMAGG